MSSGVTPAWTPAFVRAATVVTDTGSIASHASIVAREYGLPGDRFTDVLGSGRLQRRRIDETRRELLSG